MAVGDACTVGQRAKLNGFWYACTETNVWTLVQPTCTENTKYTGGTLNNGAYTFTSTSVPNGSKIAGDYPSTGTRYCYVYDSTSNSWLKKTDADCGENASGGAWYGCTVVVCVEDNQTCTVNTECCNYDADFPNWMLCENVGGATTVCVECQNCVDYWGGGTIHCSTGQTHCGGVVTCMGGHFQATGQCPERI